MPKGKSVRPVKMTEASADTANPEPIFEDIFSWLLLNCDSISNTAALTLSPSSELDKMELDFGTPSTGIT